VSKPKAPQPVKLIISILTGNMARYEQAREMLAAKYGDIDYTSAALPFDFTDYYEKELGKGLFRHLVGFKELIDPGRLPQIKLYTNRLEDRFLRDGVCRSVNVDPGYMALCHFVLASCKSFTHRPYLGDGVYADLTLVFRNKSFRALAWTFPDYASKQMIDLLNTLRNDYYQQLKILGETVKC